MDMQTFYRGLGKNIRDLRMKSGVTQEGLGNFSDPKIGRATVANIEHGRQQVSAYQLQRFADALEVTTDALMPTAKRTRDATRAMDAFSKRLQDVINKHNS